MSVRKVYLGWLPKGVANAKALKTSYDIAIGSLPTKIVVTRPPNKLDYVDGEAIDLTGIIVDAYCDDESAFSVVPTKELIIEPTAADSSKISSRKATSDLITGSIPLGDGNVWYATNPGETGRVDGAEGGDIGAIVREGNNLPRLVTASASPFRGDYYEDWTGKGSRYNVSYFTASSRTINGKTVYFGGFAPGLYVDGYRTSVEVAHDIGTTDYGIVAWTMVWGTITNAGQVITIKWHRPIDNQVLETSFTINIVESNSAIEHTYHGEQED